MNLHLKNEPVELSERKQKRQSDPFDKTRETMQQVREQLDANALEFRAWLPIVSPTLTWDWKHQLYLYDRLKSVTDGETDRLQIAMPPRHTKCLSGDMKILLASGEWLPIRDTKVGDEVVSLGKDYKWTKDVIISKVESGVKPLLRLNLSGNQRLIATNEHRILTFDGWKTFGELTTADTVAVARSLPDSQNGNLTKHDATLLAVWIAEGRKISKTTRANFRFANGLPAVIDLVKEATAAYGWTLTKTKWAYDYSITNFAPKKNGNTPMNFLRRFDLIGQLTDTVGLPKEVFTAKREVAAHFLSVLWACDGCVARKSQVLKYTTKSEQLARDVQRLLLRFGVRSVIAPRIVRFDGRDFESWNVSVSDAQSILSFADSIGIVGKEIALAELVEAIKGRGISNNKFDVIPAEYRGRLKMSAGWFRKNHNLRIDKKGGTHRDKVAKAAQIDENEDLYNLATGDVSWHQILSIEPEGDGETFDIETKVYHNFIAENVVTHNSETVTVRYAAWRLERNPSMRIIIGAYNQKLANRFSRKIRRLLQGRIEFSEDCKAVEEWETAAGGGIRAVGVGGGIAGYGADLVIIDDPVKNRKQAESETYRENTWEWFSDDIYTRLEPGGQIILIQTRWHADDLAGRLQKEMLEEDGEHWEVVSLPAIAEENDPLGRKSGEALCPARYNEEALAKRRKKLGEYSFAALFQQRPVPRDGGLFKFDWFANKTKPKAPDNLKWKRGYDLAISQKTSADFTASFKTAYDADGNLWIADGFCKRIEYPEQKRYVIGRMTTEKNTEHGIEKALHGLALVQDLRRVKSVRGVALRSVPVDADKYTRALSWANLAEEGKVFFVQDSPGNRWIKDLIDELMVFTGKGETHDDRVDAISVSVQMHSKRRGKLLAF